MISGWPLVFSSLFLSAWLLVLLWITWRVIRTPRGGSGRIWLTRMGLSCASLAILALLGLHLTWISPDISQKLGVGTVHVFAVLVFYSTIAGVVLNLAGSGTTRFVGLASCVATGIWWFVLLTGAALSMGSVTARHATRYLIPSGYVGWVRVEYGVGGPPLERSKGTYILSSAAKWCGHDFFADGRRLGVRRVFLLPARWFFDKTAGHRVGQRWNDLGGNYQFRSANAGEDAESGHREVLRRHGKPISRAR